MNTCAANFKDVSDREELDKMIRNWKRMSKAAKQMTQGLQSSLSDLSRAQTSYEVSKRKATERAALLQQREALAKVQAEMKKAARDALATEALCPLLSAPTKAFMAATVLGSAPQIAPDTNMESPWVMKDAPVLKVLKDKIGDQIMEFANKHVDEEQYQKEGKVSWPLAPKKGGWEAEKAWNHFVSLLPLQLLDISQVAPNWNTTTWLYAVAKGWQGHGLLPNSASSFKAMVFWILASCVLRPELCLPAARCQPASSC